jgi:hypothetical protein
MRLPGMSFENDWMGLVIRDQKANVTQVFDGSLVYTEVRRGITHYVLGTEFGHTSFCDAISSDSEAFDLPDELQTLADEAIDRVFGNPQMVIAL